MTNKKFTLWHRVCALVAFAVSAVTYLMTIEPSASYWDCGEFIASSYKLEVGHPPGNPVFQLFARIFTMLGDNMHAAILVNSMSAICSALTILLLYLTIVWLAQRLIRKSEDGGYTAGQAIAIMGSGLVGALAYCFSDTFWFSAVEGEVYAMSSLFTAVVFWLMTRWYDHAEEPNANRRIVLIAFLMGLSIGVHLLNLLAIPALVFMFYYRFHENEKFTFKAFCEVFLISCVILGLLVFIFIPYLPKVAAYVDLFFVNVLGLPYNVGAAVFMVVLLGALFWAVFFTMKKEKVVANTVLLCATTIVIGFSIFAIDIIRSCAKTPTNEYQPDNAFTLVRYLNREQYGSTPLIYGQYYDAPYELKQPKYWAPLDGKYKKVDGPVDAKYLPAGKMLFPRMWSSSPDGRYEQFYRQYTGGKGKSVEGSKTRKPTMWANLSYFFDYQMNWMYWRYFMWNFVGRQNEIHSPTPGDIFAGNWESGIKPIDNIRLGDQSMGPDLLTQNKGKNHYFFLPLILGLIGLCFQFARDKRGCWLNFLMFFMTGIAIVLYLNQPPYQVRERDYAYAGSFYFFSVWIGLAVAAIWSWFDKLAKGKNSTAIAAAVSVVCLLVPVEMGAENWDDHDRSNRKTAVEMARNYLNSVGQNGILITHGDNDTFPLWYAQEVEDVRTDVRICNTSLLGTDWHIDQMKWAVNESAPLDLSLGPEFYLYGNNEYIPVVDNRNTVMSISDVMKLFKHQGVKVGLGSGRKVDYIASRKIAIPVNRENVIKYGILDAKYESQIPDTIVIQIPENKDYLSKPELFLLDFLSNYKWDRPLNMLNMGGDLNIGLKDYLEYEGYSYKFIPIRNKISTTSVGFVDTDELYRLMTEVYSWDALGRTDWFVDYQNMYTSMGVMSIRGLFMTCAQAFMDAGENDRAKEMIFKCEDAMKAFPVDGIPIGLSTNDYYVISEIETLYKLGETEKARDLGTKLAAALISDLQLYYDYYDFAKSDFELTGSYIYYLSDAFKDGGDKEIADKLLATLNKLMGEE